MALKEPTKQEIDELLEVIGVIGAPIVGLLVLPIVAAMLVVGEDFASPGVRTVQQTAKRWREMLAEIAAQSTTR